MSAISELDVKGPRLFDQAKNAGRATVSHERGRISAGTKVFWLMVVIPTLLTSLYYVLVAADQYESQAKFIIQGSNSLNPTPSTNSFLGIGAPIDPAANMAFSVIAYMKSHDAVSALQKR